MSVIGVNGFALAGLLVLSCGDAISQGLTPRDAIADAWQKRQERIRSARFTFSGTTTHTKASFSDFWKRNPRNRGEIFETVPPDDTTFSVKGVLTLDGQKMRYSVESSDWSKKTKRYERVSDLAVFNGDVSKDLNTTGATHERYWPQGMIRHEKRNVFAADLILQPMLMTCRGATRGMRAYELEAFELSTQNVVIDRDRCWEMQRRSGGTRTDQLYVAPDKGFVIVRYLVLSAGIVTQKIDVTFEATTKGEWLPKQWLLVRNRSDGKLEESHQVRLENYELNPTLPSDDFELEFPPGTRVHDARDRSDWIVKPDGSGKRPIPRSDFGVTYEQMLATHPGYANSKPQPAGAFPWVATIAILVASGCLTALVFRYLKSRRDT